MMEGIKMDVKILKDNKIDVDHGLELLGDMDFYNETLETFYKNIDKNIKDLKKFKEKKDFENYGILSHSIKSDSKYLGFMDLAEIALSHEMAGKGSDEKFIEENFDSFMEEINRIVKVVKEYLGR
jgi:HPt (histidine-containing phosphotransfer) domain-containing protein